MNALILAPKSEHPKDKPAKVVVMPRDPKKIADAVHNVKVNEKKEKTLFVTECIFKARKYELF